MPRGGARNRSGPHPDENSLKSAKVGYSLTALPSEGYQGEVPAFPLPDATAREAEVWQQAWRTPQAAAWSMQAWRHRTVALWVRWSVRMEDPEAGAALGNVVVRLADQIGLTPAGLKENGWKIATDQVAAKRADKQAEAAPSAPSARERLKAVTGGGT
ncbi:hypothetical protein OG423_14190 [Micromonospora zamorensis]|uniref:hypothetical protein n=1 Tax=Micromonospora zamorensis TaxID=709883 RepID=UPI00352A7B36|nr:hypothetical protein OG423_14190 [Micromonospora zamorensis]